MKKLFFETKMTWKKVIIFALITSVLTALFAIIPLFRNTSFLDVATNFDCWILFALIIILNCESAKEASIKCFVFFLIGQPLIYLLQVPFSPLGFKIFDFYPQWLLITFLTIPGAFIAYQIKRKDWLSVVVLAVANGFLAYMIAYYLRMMKVSFPNHLLSTIFCLLSIIAYTLSFIKDKKKIIVSFIIPLVIFVVAAISLDVFKTKGKAELELGNNYEYRIDNESIVDIEYENGKYIFTSKNQGETSIFFKDENGIEHEYIIYVYGSDVLISNVN